MEVKQIYITAQGGIPLGRQGENKARQIVFPQPADLLAETWTLLVQRPRDREPYPAPLEKTDTALIWNLTTADTAQSGKGRAQLVCTGGNGEILLSRIWLTDTLPSLGEPGETPEPIKPYLSQLTMAAAKAESQAQAAGVAAETASQMATQAQEAQETAQRAGELARESAEAAEKQADAAEESRSGAESAEAEAKGAAKNATEAQKVAQSAAESAATAASSASESCKDAENNATLAQQSARTAAVQAERAQDIADELEITDPEALTLLISCGIVSPVADSSGKIYTSGNKILVY